MRSYLYIALALIALSTKISGQPADTLKFISARAVEFREAMCNANNPILIDVRESFEYRKKRIKGAVNIPYPGSIKGSADTIGINNSLFLYCTTGVRSKWAAKIYYECGFRKIYSLEGGIKGWMESSLPVDRKRLRSTPLRSQ